jgi:hypothetical protein
MSKTKCVCVFCEYCGYVNLLDDEPTECPGCGRCFGLSKCAAKLVEAKPEQHTTGKVVP